MSMELPYMFIVRPSAEIGLKTHKVRALFLRKLEKNMGLAFKRAGIEFKIRDGIRYFLLETSDQDRSVSILKRIFGISSFSPVLVRSTNELKEIEYVGEKTFASLVNGKTFCIRSKKFGSQIFSTRDVEINLGARLAAFGKVKLQNPEITVYVDVHNKKTFMYYERIAGAKGFPSGVQNHALALISGGFDSPVAAWRVMRRGVNVDFIFFNLGGRAYEKQVLQIVKILVECWAIGQNPRLFVVDFQHVLKDIKSKILSSYRQVVLKRQMIRAACIVGKEIEANALVTGESIAQVSSQTLPNLNVIDQISDIQVLRPLISMEKEEIIAEAERIGTGLLSEKVQEYCSISQGSPVQYAKPQKVKNEELGLDQNLLTQAVLQRKAWDVFSITAKDLKQDFLLVDKFEDNDQIIDCQQSHMYRAWHVPNSLHISPESFATKIKSLDKKRRYVLYCTYGTQTPLLAELMQQQGFDAYAFSGGLKRCQLLFPGRKELFLS